MAKSYINKIKN